MAKEPTLEGSICTTNRYRPWANEDTASDSIKIARYPLRYFASAQELHANDFRDPLLNGLVESIIWPRGALGEAAEVQKNEKMRSGDNSYDEADDETIANTAQVE